MIMDLDFTAQRILILQKNGEYQETKMDMQISMKLTMMN